jgi:aspartate/methionine/tyrosine aminotransferase
MMTRMLTLSTRATTIAPFYVMEMAKRAAELAPQFAAQGRDLIRLNIGEPDFTAPPSVIAAAHAAMNAGKTNYTHAMGLDELRQAISQHYADAYGLNISPARIMVTAGASAGLLLACALLINADDEVLMPDPSYPCNRQFVTSFGGRSTMIETTAAQQFQPTAAQIAAHWSPHTKAVLLASPSNPTGTTIAPDELRAIHTEITQRNGALIVDEIYGDLVYTPALHQPSNRQSALALAGAEHNTIVLSSFSKYFNMTGWRLGWMVLPEAWVSAAEKLAQNLFICPSTLAQHAGVACFAPENIAIFETRKAEFMRRRDYVVQAMREIGFGVSAMPEGAFYVYADVSHWRINDKADSEAFAFAALEQAGVVLASSRDFSVHHPRQHIRLSYAASMDQLEIAMQRLHGWTATMD